MGYRSEQRRGRRPRRRLLHLALASVPAAAVLWSATSAFAFAPTVSTPLSFPTTSVGRSRGTRVPLGAKRRRNDSLDDEEAEQPYSEPSGGAGVDDGSTGEDGAPKQTTLSGGSSLIFEMARRMLVWDDELYQNEMLNDAGSREVAGAFSPSPLSMPKPPSVPSAAPLPLPRWRPSAIRQQSISNVNPSFRTSSPVMTNAGYAGILRRNSRKRNKPSMWRHCLRVYAKMGELEREAKRNAAEQKESEGSSVQAGQIPGVGTNLAPTANPRSNSGGTGRRNRVRRSTAHHEAALVAASKLGMWEEALLIYRGVEKTSLSRRSDAGTTSGNARRKRGGVTDNMILSVVNACVKGSKVKRCASSAPDDTDASIADETTNNTLAGNATESSSDATFASQYPPRPVFRELTVEERRRPLDMARDIVVSMEEKHDIPLVSRHVNQLASAYNKLGLRTEAAALINDHLQDRTPPPPTKQTYSKQSKHWKEKREENELTSDNPRFEEGVQLVAWNDLDASIDDDDDDDEDDYSDGYEELELNVHQLKAKDRASYALLVQGAAMDGDWVGAVKELQRMTDAGLHPNSRNLHSWSEVAERGCRPSGNGEQNNSDASGYFYGGRRRRRSWKKKRDGIWLGNLR